MLPFKYLMFVNMKAGLRPHPSTEYIAPKQIISKLFS
jgi:hypothetical protein